MKKLYLIRHAKSSWKHPGLIDFERPLNHRGKKDAPFMGERLKKFGVLPDILLASPAKRAMRTAETIAEATGYPGDKIVWEDDIYEAEVMDLLFLVRGLDDSCNSAMLVGHNPGLTEFACYLTQYPIENIPTCGIFAIDFEKSSWKDIGEGRGKMQFFDFPKKHKK